MRTIGIKRTKEVMSNPLWSEILDWLAILSIAAVVGLILIILVPLVLLYGIFSGAVLIWEEYGIRNNGGDSRR